VILNIYIGSIFGSIRISLTAQNDGCVTANKTASAIFDGSRISLLELQSYRFKA